MFIPFSDGAFTLAPDDAPPIDTADAKPAETASIAAANRIIHTLLIVSSFDFTPYCQDSTIESVDRFSFREFLLLSVHPENQLHAAFLCMTDSEQYRAGAACCQVLFVKANFYCYTSLVVFLQILQLQKAAARRNRHESPRNSKCSLAVTLSKSMAPWSLLLRFAVVMKRGMPRGADGAYSAQDRRGGRR